MEGLVLDIKRLSVHDGPGIRTTVYLKGCTLRCRWCHNPESISPEPEIALWPGKCIGCRQCAEVCPTGAHVFADAAHRFVRELCTACGSCVAACLPEALEYHGRAMSPETVATAVAEDRTFYDSSGGGCTVSGGEPLVQPEFCAKVGGLLRAAGIHFAVDTSGAVQWQDFAAVLPCTDMFLYDLKHTDDRLHCEHTGSSNNMILENLSRLTQCNVPIEIRIPTIPGFNADAQSMAAMGEFLHDLPNITGVRLLPYHRARLKYEAVGLPDTIPDYAPPDDGEMAGYADILKRQGLNVVD